MKLIITEKPSVGRDIAGVLGKFQARDGFMEDRANQYLVTWAFGHLVSLAEPDDYDPALKKWRLDSLPIIPSEYRLKALAKTGKQLKIIQQLLRDSRVEEVICATDAGREGELIFRRIYSLSGIQKPIRRLWLSETTPAAIRKAFNELRRGEDMENLAAAAEARSIADWLIGMNGTRAFSVRHNNLLSVGRVQTPTLNLLVTREIEIRNFKSAPYWELTARFQTEGGEVFGAKWHRGDQNRLDSQEEADQILAGLPNEASVAQVDRQEKRQAPPVLFNLNDLQKEANRKFGLTAQRVLDTAQALYERHKLLTYPRTDSRHLSATLVATLPERIRCLGTCREYAPLVPKEIGPLGKRFVDDSKVSDHHALIPTAMRPDLSKLSKEEGQIYDLVVRRFLAIFYPDREYAETAVEIACGSETFKAKGIEELALGWKAVYQESGGNKKKTKGAKDEEAGEDEEAQPLPVMQPGDPLEKLDAEGPKKETKPPKRYTEATLLSAMENAGNLVEQDDLSKILKKAKGIGTPATRAGIIERLIQVGYVVREKKILKPTAKGEGAIGVLPEILKSLEITAQWEQALADIEEGRQDAASFLHGIEDLTRTVVKEARTQRQQVDLSRRREQPEKTKESREERTSFGPCPLCGSPIIEGKRGFGCSGWKKGCSFVIWKEISGKVLTAANVKQLLEKGKTRKIKGFVEGEESFEATLILQEGQVQLVR